MTFDYAEFAAAFPWFFPVAAGLFGAIVGSFLNVVIYRMPLDKSIVTPGSHCACGAPIRWYDNIPVLSWFILRGKARCCGRPYSFRYPFVELLTAALFLTSWLMFPPAKALCGMLFVSCLLCATFIDLDHMIIPEPFTIGLGVVGVVLSVFVPSLHNQDDGLFFVSALHSGVISLQGLLVGSGLVLWIAVIAETLLKKEAMGFADVTFVGAIGAFTGWQGAVFAVFGGAVVGTVWIGLAALVKKLSGSRVHLAPRAETADGKTTEDLGMNVHVPFGPMLAIGGLLHFFCFSAWMDDYFAELAAMFQ
ncbi:MAG: peptidase [Rariglobus sp.]|jgi:leader peptidase (prepilin peptidase)/N-methyltransferase|nr:peptidase [Rariglobus sp.]